LLGSKGNQVTVLTVCAGGILDGNLDTVITLASPAEVVGLEVKRGFGEAECMA